ncbi:MAG: OFA family MFS transporter [candidate division NC10 bacterium]|nr:OFA family MFS transporter [candidate division NC10 bacterium]
MDTKTLNRWWRIAGGLSMNLALGAVYAWSIFVRPLEQEFGWKRADVSTVFTVLVFVFGLTFVLGGRMQDKLGPTKVSLIGAGLNSLGFFMAGYTTSIAWMIFWLGVVAATGQGFGYSTPIPVMSKWFPDRRGLAVGLAVAGYGGGSAIFGPLGGNWLIPTYGWRNTFFIFGVIFLVMGLIATWLLQNPPAGYKPEGWQPSAAAKAAATKYEFLPSEAVKTPTMWFMWVAYALGTAAGLMVISQLVPFARQQGHSIEIATTAIFVGAIGSASGRILSGWMSDGLGRLNVLRLMIGVSALSMFLLFHVGASVAMLYLMVFVIYWCYGTQLSVNASTSADFWGTKNVGANYGILFTAWGVAGIIGPRIGGQLYDKFGNYEYAFYVAGVLSIVALVFEFIARRPTEPVGAPVQAKA